MTDQETEYDLKKLKKSIDRMERTLDKIVNRRFVRVIDHPLKFWGYSVLSGIAIGVGYAIGVTLLVAFLLWLVGYLKFIPIIGDDIGNIVEVIRRK